MSLLFRRNILHSILPLLLIGICSPGCEKNALDELPPLSMPGDSIRFAVIGDYGQAGNDAYQVSKLIKSWNPDFIITTGDNNYDYGLLSTIRENIGQYYGDFIYNYDAPEEYRCYGKAFNDQINRFFPSPGNHDYYGTNSLIPYLTYFTLPGNEEYYEFIWGPVHFFSINSLLYLESPRFGEQKRWFEKRVKQSLAPFKVAYFHHPPYSTGKHGSHSFMQWEFEEMGISAVFAGHDHNYSRIKKKNEPGISYFVSGAGGKSLHGCGQNPLHVEKFDLFCYDDNYGAMLVIATPQVMTLQFYSIDQEYSLIDSCTVVLHEIMQ